MKASIALLLCLLAGSGQAWADTTTSRAARQASTSSTTKKVLFTAIGAATGFAAGLLVGLYKYDEAIDSDRKVWTSIVSRSEVAVTYLDFDAVYNRNALPFFTNTTQHELAHQFLGHVYLKPTLFTCLSREMSADFSVAKQAAGFSQLSFRVGLEPRRYATPANPQSNTPRP